MSWIKTGALWFLLIWIGTFAKAQEKQYLFKNIDKSIGLSHNHVICFLRDSKGFLWIGTIEGLCRYDGYSFKIFKNDPADSSSIQDNIVIRLFEDHEGNIWLRAGNLLYIFDPETEKFTHCQSLFNNRIPVPFGGRWYFLKDHHKNIIYADDHTGLYKYIIAKDSVAKISFPYSEPNRTITGVDVDRFDNLWVACTNSYMYKFSCNSFALVDSLELPVRQNNYYRFMVDRDDDLWIYDNNNASGAIYCNPKTREYRYFTTQSAKGKLSSDDLRTLVEDDDGMIWLGTDHGGISIVDKKDFSVRVIKNDPSVKRSLCDNSITKLYKDYQGFIWVGTYKRGISYYHKNQYIFELHKVLPQYKNISGYNDINNMVEDKKGNIWIGSNGGGLIYYDRDNNTFKQYINNTNDPESLSSNVVIGLFLDSKDRLWVGTYFGGLNRFDGRKFQRFKNIPSDSSSLSDDRIWDICEDSRGMLWIGTLMGGVNIFDPEKNKVIEHLRVSNDTVARPEAVFTVKQGSNHLMWLTTANGLGSYDINTRKFTYYIHRQNDPSSISNNVVYDVFEDSRGFMWITTSDGLNLFNQSTGNFRTFKQEDGLASNFILAILEDQHHNLWMTTSNGISKLMVNKDNISDTFSFKFVNFFVQDGLQSNEFNEKAILKTSKGEMVFGGPNGFNIINPENLKTQNLNATVVFTDFQIFNKSISINKQFNHRIVLDKSISYTKSIRLKYNEDVFTLEFSSMNFMHPERIQYLYKLDNFNDEWFSTDSYDRKISYTNLDPGKYLFRVKATNNDGSYTNNEAQLKIIITPPWWGTLIFKIACILFLASVLAGFYYFRLFQLGRQKRRLEMKVKERTNELSAANIQLQERQNEILVKNRELENHQNQLEQLVQERTERLEDAMNQARESDRLKSAFLANMSHEIRTPMNAIVGFSGLLNDPTLTEEERNDYIKLIQNNSDSLLLLINDILDLSMIEANQMTIHKEPFYLNKFLEQLYTIYKHANKNQNLRIFLNNTLENMNLKLVSDKYRLNQVLSNFMNNACKFTEMGDVELGAGINDGFLNLYVKDTGIGISAQEIRFLFERFRKLGEDKTKIKGGIGLGLAISKSLTELLGGKLDVISEKNNGSVFTFNIPVENIITEDQIKKSSFVENDIRDWSNKCFLVVEDEEANYIFLEKVLEKTNATVVWASKGEEAIQKFASGKHIDLILLDIKMPGMDGYETLKELRNNGCNLPVIAQTAYAQPEDEINIRKSGFDDYVAKPIHPKLLIELIEKYLQ